MKISYESEDGIHKCSFTVPEDIDIYDMMDILENLLHGIGYSQNVVKEGFLAQAEVYKNE